jgi:hypothetical protein
MIAFQWITVPILLLLFVGTAAATARHRFTIRSGVAWSLFWLAAAVAIAWPDLGRSADLILYLVVVCMAIGFFVMFLRLRKLEENLTKVVREIALDRPLEPRSRE